MTFGILALGFPVSQVLQPLGAHSLTFFSILMHSLGDVWHPRSGVPCFAGFAAFGGPQSQFLQYLNAFLGWRLASWLWDAVGFPVSQVLQPLGAHSLTFFTILMHFLGDVWHPGSGVPCFAGFAAFGGPQSHFLQYLNAFLRWRLASSWLWGSLFRMFCSLWGPTVSLSSIS